MNLTLLLRLTGASLIALSLFHAVLWRYLRWGQESDRLSPLNARVFAAHTFFIAFVLAALGLLSLLHPELLLVRSELARLLSGATVVFWLARLLVQLFFFDQAIDFGPTRRWSRYAASLPWVAYAVIYAAVYAEQG